MNLDHYKFDADSKLLSFEFISEGPKGRIKKIIQFTKLTAPYSTEPIYNLGFGDYNEAKGKIDDLVVSNNGDSEKILATVAAGVILFLEMYPNAQVFAQGSTPSRTRFYIMGISKNLNEIKNVLEILGAISENEWEFFKENRPYTALLVKRK
jgi:hypothetical protein